MNNLSCRIFAEQVKLLLSLPDQEEAKIVLYQSVVNSFNQFEKHFDNQIENQNENAYYLNHLSDSVSLSLLSKSILDLLSKNIVWKEFSNNYGGKRQGAGRKSDFKINQIENQNEKKSCIPKDWKPSEETINNLKERGLVVSRVVRQFINSCAANGYTYENFDKALLSWNWENDKNNVCKLGYNEDGVPY